MLLAISCCLHFSYAQNFAWATGAGSTGYDLGASIAVDPSGNGYTTGWFSSSVDFDPGAATYTMTSAGSTDIFVSKNDANGNFLWAKRFGSTGMDNGAFIALDAVGNIYVTGFFKGTVDFDTGPAVFNLTSTPAYDGDAFILKLDANGNFLWALRIGDTGYDAGTSINFDASGNVYVAGNFELTVDFDPGVATYTLNGFTGNGFVLKLGATGNFIWAKSLGNSINQKSYCYSAKLDGSGNICLAGFFLGITDFDPGPGTFTVNTVPTPLFGLSNDLFILKLDPAGNFLWVKTIGGNDTDIGTAITVDAMGNLYATGCFSGNVDFDPGPATYSLTSNGPYHVFILSLDANGNFIWAKSLGNQNSNYEISTGILIEPAGNILITGDFGSVVDFDPSPSTYTVNGVLSDGFILKLSAAGNFIWVKTIGGPSYEYICSIAVTPLGDIYVTGDYAATVDFDPGPASYTLSAAGGADLFIEKLSCTVPVIAGSQTVCENGSASYTLSGATGLNSHNWSVIPGAVIVSGQNTATLSVLFAAASGSVSVMSENSCGVPLTVALMVTVTALPNINIQPSNQNLTINSNAQFTINAGGSSLLFQWQENSGSGFANLSGSTTYSGINTATLTVSNVLLSQDNYSYRCIVENLGCAISSDAGILNVYDPVSIEEIKDDEAISIYPNPAGKSLFIESGSSLNKVPFTINDMDGSNLVEGTTNKSGLTVVDLQLFAPGFYFIKIGQQKKTFKIIKE